MTRNSAIELTPGTGRVFGRCSLGLWLGSAVGILALAGRLPAAAVVLAGLVLVSEWPGHWQPACPRERLRLFQDGSAELGGKSGSWSPAAWSTAWLTVVSLALEGRRQRVVVASWRNDADDYRVLRTWLRHPPFTAGDGRVGGSPGGLS
ncbi:hypothetical protein [Elongatibacter sediminis]|uniref:Toxin CptA n=1 Tax=Elongatibacter sediminis TaxID=3119006 RepID=A0AAW9RHG6_9GAMM